MFSDSYSFPPVTFELRFMKSETPEACGCPESYVGHNSQDRNRTAFGVYICGSCVIVLSAIQALGRSLPHHRWLSESQLPPASAQKCGGACSQWSELGLRILPAAPSASAVEPRSLLRLRAGQDVPQSPPREEVMAMGKVCLFTRRAADALPPLSGSWKMSLHHRSRCLGAGTQLLL